MIGLSWQCGLNKNVCHFSVASLCCWNLQDVFRLGFSFQASGLISRSGISSSSTVCYCKAAVALSAACECVLKHHTGCVHFCARYHISVSVGLCQFELVHCMFVCPPLCRASCACVCLLSVMGSFAVSAAVSPQL